MTCRGVVKGKMIELEEELPYPKGQPVTVLVEPMTGQHPPGSPAAILKAIAQLPRLDPADVDALDQAIADSKLPARNEEIFDDER